MVISGKENSIIKEVKKLKENYEKYNNKNLNNYLKYYEKAKEEISTKMRIEKIYKYLNNTQGKDPSHV